MRIFPQQFEAWWNYHYSHVMRLDQQAQSRKYLWYLCWNSEGLALGVGK